MTKRNYAAWKIDTTLFSDSWSDAKKLEFFARFAVLAPSGHNTQPWQLLAQKESILVSVHPDHHLSIDGSGLLSVEPYISLGSFLEVFTLAAKGYGYELDIELFPKKTQVAEISIKRTALKQPELLDAITKRVSNRHAYTPSAVPQKALKTIVGDGFAKVTTTLITDRSDIAFVADQSAQGITGIMSKPLYREELSNWVRANQTRQFDGMPGFTHGFGTLQALVSKAAIKHAPAGGPQAKKSADLIRNSGALVIVRCIDDTKESFINAGRLYARICVVAQDNGYATSALGASVLDPDTRKNVSKRFDIKDRPIYLLRIGKPSAQSRHSPRWPLEKVLSRAAD